MARTSVGIELGAHSVKVVHLRVVDQCLLVENAIYLDRKALAARSVDIEDRRAVASLLRSMMNERRLPPRAQRLPQPIELVHPRRRTRLCA